MKYTTILFHCFLALWGFQIQAQEGVVEERKSDAYYDKLLANQAKAMELHAIGYEHYANYDYDSAVFYYDLVMGLDSSNANYFANRGHAHKALGNWEGALSDYERCNAIDAKLTYETYFFAAEILNKELQEYEKALGLYSKAASMLLDEEDAKNLHLCYFNNGNIYLRLKHYEEAIKFYTEALKLKPEHSPSLSNRGVAYMSIKRNGLACEDWRKAAGLGETNSQRYIEDGYCK